MTTQAIPTTLHARSAETLSNGVDSIMLADGTVWSHAATLGTRTKGSTFTIDRATIDNFVRLFTSVPGCRKVPVDYEHSTVNGATDTGQPIPKAGDVFDLKGVYSVDDFTGELRTAAEKLAKAAGRTLDDPRNFGLWTRWRPVARALAYIQAGEITEMSIAFGDDVPDNITGEGQGPGLVSIALTNLPFLDDMLPVAASRTTDLPAPRGDHMTTPVQNTRVLALVGALVGTAVASDDDAVTALTTFAPEAARLRTFARDVGEAIGEPDPVKALAKVKQLSTENQQLSVAAAAAKTAAIATQVESYLVKHEKKLTVPLKKMLAAALTKELEEGKKLEETETAKTVESLPDTGITTQTSAGDKGEKPDEDDALVKRVDEIMKTDELKELSKSKGYTHAYNRACEIAEEEVASNRRKSA